MQAAFASTSQRKSYGLIDALRPTGFSNVFPVWIEFACVDAGVDIGFSSDLIKHHRGNRMGFA